jgi:hypothetical protein
MAGAIGSGTQSSDKIMGRAEIYDKRNYHFSMVNYHFSFGCCMAAAILWPVNVPQMAIDN